MKPYRLVLVALLGAFTLPACYDSSPSHASGTGYTYYEVREYSYDQRDSFRADMEQAIAKLEMRAAQLKAKAAELGQEVKAGTKELIDEIEAELPKLRSDLAAVGDATREGWQDLQRNFRTMFDDLGRRIDSLLD